MLLHEALFADGVPEKPYVNVMADIQYSIVTAKGNIFLRGKLPENELPKAGSVTQWPLGGAKAG